MKKYIKIFGKILIALVFCLAIWLLYQKLQSYSMSEIKEAISQISPANLILSCVFMVLNYIVLMGYDWLALRAIKKNLTFARVSLVSFIGSVVSLNFGALLGGSTVRYRLYTAWGFTPLDIVRLVLMLAVTFWVGAMGLAGLLFIFVPLELPPELGMGIVNVRPLGFGLLVACILYHLLCWKANGRAIIIRGKAFALPPFNIAIIQTLVAGIDLVVAAACLYVLFPLDSALSFFEFLPNYLLAQIAVVLTHVPGGVGVLEVILVNLISHIPASTVFATILVFRVIYYLLPLMFASILLGVNEFMLRRKPTASTDAAKEALNDWFLTTMKYVVFITGVLFCLSAVLPIALHDFTLVNAPPILILTVAYLLRGVVGVILIVFAYGLEQKQINHWIIIVVSLCIGWVSLVFSGGKWVGSIVILAVLFPLLVAKYKFTRDRVLVASHYPLKWLISSVTVVASIMLLTYGMSVLSGGGGGHWSGVFDEYNFSAEQVALLVQVLTGIVILLVLVIADSIYKKRYKRKNPKKKASDERD